MINQGIAVNGEISVKISQFPKMSCSRGNTDVQTYPNTPTAHTEGHMAPPRTL